jgi:hypothetical protein
MIWTILFYVALGVLMSVLFLEHRRAPRLETPSHVTAWYRISWFRIAETIRILTKTYARNFLRLSVIKILALYHLLARLLPLRKYVRSFVQKVLHEK